MRAMAGLAVIGGMVVLSGTGYPQQQRERNVAIQLPPHIVRQLRETTGEKALPSKTSPDFRLFVSEI